MACVTPPELDYPRNTIEGDVTAGELTIIGANTVVMPNQTLPVGVAIGALSFVPSNYPFEEWNVYAGIPIRPIKKRNKKEVLKQKSILQEQLSQ